MMQRPALAGFACFLALAQASAEELSVVGQTPAKTHAIRAKTVKPTPVRAASLGVPKSADFLRLATSPPVEPKGGFTIKAGRDSPDAPMTGGLMFRF